MLPYTSQRPFGSVTISNTSISPGLRVVVQPAADGKIPSRVFEFLDDADAWSFFFLIDNSLYRSSVDADLNQPPSFLSRSKRFDGSSPQLLDDIIASAETAQSPL